MKKYQRKFNGKVFKLVWKCNNKKFTKKTIKDFSLLGYRRFRIIKNKSKNLRYSLYMRE